MADRQLLQRQPRNGRDSGAGSAAILAVVTLAIAGVVFLAAFGQVQSSRHRAQASADLAALAAARELQVFGIEFDESHGTESVCEIATDVARRNGTKDVHCEIERHDVLVTAHRDVNVLGVTLTISARARAGPAHQVEFGGLPIGG